MIVDQELVKHRKISGVIQEVNVMMLSWVDLSSQLFCPTPKYNSLDASVLQALDYRMYEL
jgi:hypothetical protein